MKRDSDSFMARLSAVISRKKPVVIGVVLAVLSFTFIYIRSDSSSPSPSQEPSRGVRPLANTNTDDSTGTFDTIEQPKEQSGTEDSQPEEAQPVILPEANAVIAEAVTAAVVKPVDNDDGGGWNPETQDLQSAFKVPFKIPPLAERVEPEGSWDKWIVLTSIQGPTADTVKLAAVAGWRLLIVADKKTPKDYWIPDAKVLHVAEQDKLNFKLQTIQPWKHYTRKNVGYLYAMKNGAKYIYETDDDNHPTDGLKSFLMQDAGDKIQGLVWNTTYTQVNPYIHFGQSSMWPRGSGLSRVGAPASRSYFLCETTVPLVQQGLVNGDPDMDAIYRLTRKNTLESIDVTFDGSAPPVILPKGSLSPYNSQNTLFHYEAFWSLMLPFSKMITWRVCDIWRGYATQPLLWHIGSRLAFFAPNAHQVRNGHDFLIDYKDEVKIYQEAEQMMDFLSKWACKAATLPECYLELWTELAKRKHFDTLDVEAAKLWLEDLNNIGYKFPPLKFNTQDCAGRKQTLQFYPNEQPSSFPSHAGNSLLAVDDVHILQNELLFESCKARQESWNTSAALPSTVLVVGMTKKLSAEMWQRFDTLYSPLFSHKVYCGNNAQLKNLSHWRPTFIQTEAKPNFKLCVEQVRSMGYPVEQFVYIQNDVFLSSAVARGLESPSFSSCDPESVKVAKVSNTLALGDMQACKSACALKVASECDVKLSSNCHWNQQSLCQYFQLQLKTDSDGTVCKAVKAANKV